MTFHPDVAGPDVRDIYLDVTGQEERLPLKLRGQGVGPVLDFDVDAVDIGQVFVGSTHTYTLTLSNLGEIEAPFAIEADEDDGAIASCFTFTPSEGIVDVGESLAIKVCLPHVLRERARMCLCVDKSSRCRTQTDIQTHRHTHTRTYTHTHTHTHT